MNDQEDPIRHGWIAWESATARQCLTLKILKKRPLALVDPIRKMVDQHDTSSVSHLTSVPVLE